MSTEPAPVMTKKATAVLATARALARRGERITLRGIAAEAGCDLSGVHGAARRLLELGHLVQDGPQGSYSLVGDDARRAKIDRICALVAANPDQLRAVLEAEL